MNTIKLLLVLCAIVASPMRAFSQNSNYPTQIEFIKSYVMAYKLNKTCKTVTLNESLIVKRVKEYKIDFVSKHALEISGLAAEWAELVIEKENLCSSLPDMNGKYLIGDGPFPQGFLKLKQ